MIHEIHKTFKIHGQDYPVRIMVQTEETREWLEHRKFRFRGTRWEHELTHVLPRDGEFRDLPMADAIDMAADWVESPEGQDYLDRVTMKAYEQ